MTKRESMLRRVADVFNSFGFAPIATPALEYSEILLGKYGTEGDKLLYRFADNGERDVSLRYDLTVPLARVMGQHTELSKPFRRYQIAPVWRAEKPGRGRFREFVQCDVDIVGSDNLLADFECVQVGVAVLKALGVSDFTMQINDRRILDGLMERLGISGASQKMEVLRSTDKLPKIGWDGVVKELQGKLELSDTQLAALHTFMHGTLDDIDASVADMDIAGPGIECLNTLLGWAEELGIREHLAIDLSIARGLDYYTSTIYETFLGALPGFGSVMSGGRYDDLLSMFSKKSMPAVGISLGVDRLLAGLIELELAGDGGAAAQVFVLGFEDATAGAAQRVAAALRADGLSAQLHLKPGQNMGKQFKAAGKSGAAVVVVLGADEIASGEATIKHLASREQVRVPQADAAAAVRKLLG